MHTYEPPDEATRKRRNFLKWAINGLGAIFAAILGIPAIAYLTDARNRKASDSDFKTVARLSDLAEGVPFQTIIRDVRKDAWTIHPSDIIGRVWLVRRNKDQVDAFTTVCPHLGCSINFVDESKKFLCPCHGGVWDVQGERLDPAKNPAPRGMDKLEVRRDPQNADWIQVKYVQFMQGRETPIPKT